MLLLIEDNEDHARLFASVLAKHAPSVSLQAVDSIEEGVESLRGLPCDLIVVDAFLRNRSVIHRFPLLRRQAPDTPIIVLAGSGDESLAAEAIKRGATGYVVKNRRALEQLPFLFEKYVAPSRPPRRGAIKAPLRRPSSTEAMRRIVRETESLTHRLRAALRRKVVGASHTALLQRLHRLHVVAAGVLKKS